MNSIEKLERLFAFKTGDSTVLENLQHALDNGMLEKKEDGRFKLPPGEGIDTKDFYHLLRPINRYSCAFLNNFVHEIAYRESHMPFGCRNCYKVKVIPQSLRELMGLLEIACSLNNTSKVGVEVDNPISSCLYAGYFYANSLDEARQLFMVLRDAVSSHRKLGPKVSMSIKRGCTHFELKFGPSNAWTFDPELEAVESSLESLYYGNASRSLTMESSQDKLSLFANWINTAYRIGDETYLDFTGGKPHFPKTVTYHDDIP